MDTFLPPPPICHLPRKRLRNRRPPDRVGDILRHLSVNNIVPTMNDGTKDQLLRLLAKCIMTCIRSLCDRWIRWPYDRPSPGTADCCSYRTAANRRAYI